MNKETKEIEIPEELYAELTEKVELDDNYNSVEEFIVFLLNKLISDEAESADEK